MEAKGILQDRSERVRLGESTHTRRLLLFKDAKNRWQDAASEFAAHRASHFPPVAQHRNPSDSLRHATVNEPTHEGCGLSDAPFASTEKGISMRNCPDREDLIVQWHGALLMFAHSVSQLSVHKENGNFNWQPETEQARLHAENARTMVELHCTEHGC